MKTKLLFEGWRKFVNEDDDKEGDLPPPTYQECFDGCINSALKVGLDLDQAEKDCAAECAEYKKKNVNEEQSGGDGACEECMRKCLDQFTSAGRPTEKTRHQVQAMCRKDCRKDCKKKNVNEAYDEEEYATVRTEVDIYPSVIYFKGEQKLPNIDIKKKTHPHWGPNGKLASTRTTTKRY